MTQSFAAAILVLPCVLQSWRLEGCTATDHDPITAGDVAEILPEFASLPANAPLIPAPAPGVHRVVRALELQLLARRYTLDRVSEGDLCFEWPMEPIDRDSLKQAMLAAVPYPETSIEILTVSSGLVPRGRVEFRLADLGSPAAARTQSPVVWHGSIIYGAHRRYSVWARVLISARMPRVVAVESLSRGNPISPAQIRLDFKDGFPGPTDIASSLDQVSGRAPLRTIGAGSEIHIAQLQVPPEINRGDLVEVEVRSGSMRLAMAARAESQGRSGGLVALRNPSSNRTFQARVNGKGKAILDAGRVEGN